MEARELIMTALREYINGKTLDQLRENPSIRDQFYANGAYDSAMQISYLLSQLTEDQKQTLLLESLQCYVEDRPNALLKLFEIAEINSDPTFAKALDKLSPDKLIEFEKFLYDESHGLHLSLTNFKEKLPEAVGRGAVMPGILSLFLSLSPGVALPIFATIFGLTIVAGQRDHRSVVNNNVVFVREQLEDCKRKRGKPEDTGKVKISNSSTSMWKKPCEKQGIVTPESNIVLGC